MEIFINHDVSFSVISQS